MVSCSSGSWVTPKQLEAAAAVHGSVATVAFDQRRYVGTQTGIHNPQGQRVGTVSHQQNLEYLAVAGPPAAVRRNTQPIGVLAGAVS